ncbi:hypothetical protein LOTGIDRAFT_226726 [Lottia gigantea]|uniref:Chitin-binding type-4 domain-containing protein n=1 Tax=Lottia gigantea TaxID=225164 RepID=V4C8J2_LOTGI|nr:hypothetical protein LOTGIDRAFT_226726 [Lottia gigantea]ESO98059.1 hypothetical protein LOTGIDRAFT_226726 [Lottia gigantea]
MARPRRILILFMIYLFGFINGVNGNAKLIDPPNRSSMWRYGFDVPVNKQDGYLNCGGIVVSTLQNNQGRCGICGDNFSAQKENEYGGKYGTGFIGKNYTQGETVPFTVQFVLGRPGNFQFRICKLESKMQEATQECLNRTTLATADGATKLKIASSPRNKNVTFDIVLPTDLNCERCVLQWTYTTSVVYGCDKQNNCCFGCGIQERYVNCADIRINPSQAALTAAAMTTTNAPPEDTTTTVPPGSVGGSAPVSSNVSFISLTPRQLEIKNEHSWQNVSHCTLHGVAGLHKPSVQNSRT